MKRFLPQIKPLLKIVAVLLALLPAAELRAADYKIQIVADNSFALFAGTDTSITRVLYQNYASWPDQIDAADSFSITLNPGETYLYLLGMGGGGSEENISGQINSINIVSLFWQDPSSVRASSNVAPYLTDYGAGGNVEDASYTVSLSEVQAALSSLTWGDPNENNSQNVIHQNPFAEIPGNGNWGFAFPTLNAVFFKMSAESLGIPEPVPEPSTGLLLLVGLGLLYALQRIRRLRNAEG